MNSVIAQPTSRNSDTAYRSLYSGKSGYEIHLPYPAYRPFKTPSSPSISPLYSPPARHIASTSLTMSSATGTASATASTSAPATATHGNSPTTSSAAQPNNAASHIPLHVAGSNQIDSSKAKKKRTKSGCITCRKRKVKCGEEKPTCTRCHNAKVECAGYPDPVPRPKKRASAASTSATAGKDTVSRRSSTTSSSYTTNSSANSASASSTASGNRSNRVTASSSSSTGPVRKAARLSSINIPASPQSYTTSSQTPDSHQFSSYGGASIPQYQQGAPALSRDGSTNSMPSQRRFSSALTSSSTSPFEMDPVENRNQSLSNQFPINEEDEGSTYGQQPNAYSPTLAPPLQSAHLNPSSSSQMQINASTYAPFAFDSPFPFHQPFGVGYPISGQGQQYINHPHGPQNANNAGIVQHASTPFDFDSLFEYTDKNIQQQQQQQIQQQASDSGSLCLDRQGAQTQGEGTATRDTIEAHLPIDYWEDANFVDRIMSGFRDVRDRVDEQSQMRQNTQQSSTSSEIQSQISGETCATAHPGQVASSAPSLSSGKSSILSPSGARTPSVSSPTTFTFSTQDAHMSTSLSQAGTQSPRSTTSESRGKSQPLPPAAPQQPISRAPTSSTTPTSTAVSQASALPPATTTSTNTTMADFAPQPAIDPILQATSTSALHKTAANRNKIIPSLNELALGPPPNLLGNQKEWSVPFKIGETMKGMSNARHVELLKHYFVNLVGLFSPIDHPRNPFRTFVAEHATESLSLLHAVLAVSAINQQPLSVEARAESLLYFEAAVDLYVRSLQQQDDISLFTLLFLSLYYAFDSGTAQPQHFSRKAQSIINDRLELLGYDVLQASSDFRFLVRLHVWYEVMANVSRRAGDLRDMACGEYTLTRLISIIEEWDSQEEKAAGLSGVNPDYIMTGCVGVPTFFISLLNDISLLKEEQHKIISMPMDAMNEQASQIRKALISKHTRKIRDLECKIQFARPGRLLLPPIVANELQLHRAVSVRFFDLFRLAASIHLLTELQGTPVNDPAIQLRTTEMVNLLGNIEQNSNYNTSGIWAFFIAGAAASNHMDRIALHRRLDSTWNSPCGNVWSLRSVLDEVWQRNAEALENNEPCQNWKEIAQQRGWLLLLM